MVQANYKQQNATILKVGIVFKFFQILLEYLKKQVFIYIHHPMNNQT